MGGSLTGPGFHRSGFWGGDPGVVWGWLDVGFTVGFSASLCCALVCFGGFQVETTEVRWLEPRWWGEGIPQREGILDGETCLFIMSAVSGFTATFLGALGITL